MPTENRSSNTELSKIVTEALVGMVSGVTGMKPPPGEALPGFIQAPIDRAVTRISGFVTQPAPQPHPEPIAWMVGTAIWWTKEEADRDAAATGLPIVGLGPTTDTAEVERLESRIKTQRESIRSHVQEADRLRVLEIKYGLKLEERNDLLRKCLEWITSARDGVLYPIACDFEGVVGRNAEGLGQATPALIDAIDDALSDSVAPSSPLPPVNGDLLPPIGSKVLIRLAREDEWVEHTVVGYYAWDNLRPDPSVHRVCVRVRDADGYLNARGLGDIRPVALERQT